MVGNGVTDWRVDTYPPLPITGDQFQIFPVSLKNKWYDNGCEFLASTNDVWTNNPLVCEPLFVKMMTYFNTVDIYDMYRPANTSSLLKASDDERHGVTYINGEAKHYKRGHTHAEYTPWMRHLLGDSTDAPVLGDQVTDYMNLPETRAAFNIPDDVQAW